MHASSILISTAAAMALVGGSIAMASASAQTHSDHGPLGVVGEDPAAPGRAQTTATKLVGRVNDDRDLTLSDTSLNAGRYKIVVRDSTSSHNWHMFGNGQDRSTTISGTGRWVFRIRLSAGTYTVRCDQHPSTMHFSVQVS